MATYKTKLQEYAHKMHWPLPVYESVNEGFDHLPSFKCFVTVNESRFESNGAFKHKKHAEQSAAQVAIQDLYTKRHEYTFEVAVGKKLLTELLVRMGKGSPTFTVTMSGVAHSLDFTSTVEIDGASYVGGVAKSKKEAETKAAVVAFHAIKEQVGEPCLQLQLQAESRACHELEQLPEECKDIKSGLNTTTNSCTPNEFLVGTNSKQCENSLEMVITTDEDAVEKGPGMSNASDENSVPSLKPDNQLQQETILIQPDQEEIKVKNEDVQEVDLNDSVNKRSRSESEKQEQMNAPDLNDSVNKRSRSESEKQEQMNGMNKKVKNENDGMISCTSMGN